MGSSPKEVAPHAGEGSAQGFIGAGAVLVCAQLSLITLHNPLVVELLLLGCWRRSCSVTGYIERLLRNDRAGACWLESASVSVP